jgi:sulfur-carrier protein
MRITLKLFASLSEYLPAGAQANAVAVELPDSATPNEILDRLGVPRGMAHLVLRNGVYIEPAKRDQPLVQDGDTLAVWPPIAGG